MDAQGQSMTGDAHAAACYDAALTALLEYRIQLPERVLTLVQHHPHCPMGHVLQAYLELATFDRAQRGSAAAAIEWARLCVQTARERHHLAAAEAWLSGDLARTVTHWDQVLIAAPRDLLALRLRHFVDFWLGRHEAMRQRIEHVMPAWLHDSECPGLGSVLGMKAFALEECGALTAAEHCGRQAMALNRDDLWSLHAVAHVLESDNRPEEGIEWLDFSENQLADRGSLAGHLWWHRCLYLIELGRAEETLAIYDQMIWRGGSHYFTDLQNAIALLWRLEFCGLDVGERWQTLAEASRAHAERFYLPFTRTHMLLALARNGGVVPPSLLVHDEPLPEAQYALFDALAAAISALGRGKHDMVTTVLTELGTCQALGGSHAQRDLFQQILINAALRARPEFGRSLLQERRRQRPRAHNIQQQLETLS